MGRIWLAWQFLARVMLPKNTSLFTASRSAKTGAVEPDQDSKSRAVAAGNRGRKWNTGQNQVCDVGFVFSCGSLGVLWPQPDLLRHSGRKWRKERAKYGGSCQFQAPKVAVEIDRRASGASSDRARVPRSASRIPGCRTGNTSRRTRRTPLDGLRFQQPGLRHPTFLLLASGRAPHRYKVGGFGSAAADAPRAQRGLLEWRSQSLYNQSEDFVFASERLKGRKPLDLAAVLKKKIQPAFQRIGITGVGWHTFRHTVGTMLAEMGEHQLTIRDYLQHGNLHVTNKYLQATSKTKRQAQDRLVDAILPAGFLPKPNLVQ